VVFGMLVATLVGVFFIPVFYVLLQRMSERQWPFKRMDATPSPAGAVASKAGGADTPPSPARGD
jgi:HAE1 family hydrophobic/amphiphilic exporter-1/multidrug efflux pump